MIVFYRSEILRLLSIFYIENLKKKIVSARQLMCSLCSCEARGLLVSFYLKYSKVSQNGEEQEEQDSDSEFTSNVASDTDTAIEISPDYLERSRISPVSKSKFCEKNARKLNIRILDKKRKNSKKNFVPIGHKTYRQRSAGP
jgi:hypothetical protein